MRHRAAIVSCSQAATARAHPPTWMKDWEAQIVHDPVAVVVTVAIDLHTNRETLDTKVKVRAVGTLDADIV